MVQRSVDEPTQPPMPTESEPVLPAEGLEGTSAETPRDASPAASAEVSGTVEAAETVAPIVQRTTDAQALASPTGPALVPNIAQTDSPAELPQGTPPQTQRQSQPALAPVSIQREVTDEPTPASTPIQRTSQAVPDLQRDYQQALAQRTESSSVSPPAQPPKTGQPTTAQNNAPICPAVAPSATQPQPAARVPAVEGQSLSQAPEATETGFAPQPVPLQEALTGVQTIVQRSTELPEPPQPETIGSPVMRVVSSTAAEQPSAPVAEPLAQVHYVQRAAEPEASEREAETADEADSEQSPQVDIDQLTDQVFARLRRRLQIELERQGRHHPFD